MWPSFQNLADESGFSDRPYGAENRLKSLRDRVRTGEADGELGRRFPISPASLPGPVTVR
jgi:hypothetical protein